MTGRRAGVVLGKPYSPDQALIQRYATTYALNAKPYAWNKENLLAVLSKFGPLPEVGQEQLIKCLVLAFSRYQVASMTIERITPGKQRHRLKAVETTSKRLLLQLGINVKNVASREVYERLSDLPPSARVSLSAGKVRLA